MDIIEKGSVRFQISVLRVMYCLILCEVTLYSSPNSLSFSFPCSLSVSDGAVSLSAGLQGGHPLAEGKSPGPRGPGHLLQHSGQEHATGPRSEGGEGEDM